MEIWEVDVRRPHAWLTGVVGAILMTAACGGGSTPPPASNTAASPSSSPPSNVSLDKNSYPVFPERRCRRRSGRACRAGGQGVQGRRVGNQHGLRSHRRSAGGQGRRAPQTDMLSFPGTLRMAGRSGTPRSNYAINALVYETLLALHPTTLEYMPGARHALADFAGQDDVSGSGSIRTRDSPTARR